jgi:hypothetical protein
LGIITTSSHATAMKLAAEAAMPSTVAVTLALWLRRVLRMARPSQTEPPPELMRRSIFGDGSSIASRAWANSSAETPQYPPIESM